MINLHRFIKIEVLVIFALVIIGFPIQYKVDAATNGNIATIFERPNQLPVIRLLSSNGMTVVRDISVTSSVADKIVDIDWSPDGNQIAYVLHVGNFSTYIGVIDEDGSNNNIIASAPGVNAEAGDSVSWSPSGPRLSFSIDGGLYFINANGDSLYESIKNQYYDSFDVDWQDPANVTINQAFTGDHNDFPKAYSVHDRDSGISVSGTYPDVAVQSLISPSGLKSAYISRGDSNSIVEQNIDGTGRRVVYDFGQSGYPLQDLSWSPDSSRLIFAVLLKHETPDNQGRTLFELDLNTLQTRKLIYAPTDNNYSKPSWVSNEGMVQPEDNDIFKWVNSVSSNEVITAQKNYTGGNGVNYSETRYQNKGRPFSSAASWDNDSLPVYRLVDGDAFNNSQIDLLTIDEDEATDAIYYYDWGFAELSFYGFNSPGIDRMPVYRYVNTENQDRYYSADANEILLRQYANPKINYEGIGFYVPKDNSKHNPLNIYRMTNYITGERIFTQNPEEVMYAQDLYPGWKYEGIAFKSVDQNQSNASPVYRLTNYTKKERVFTSSKFEADYAVANYKGWVYEGEVFRSYKSQQSGSVPIYRLVNYAYGGRLFTASETEANYAVANYPGWIKEGIAFYSNP